MNVAEEICGEWLRHCRGCEFIQYNRKAARGGGEIDVIGLNVATQTVYCCEVAAHLSTGLLYVKGSVTANREKLIQKFHTDIQEVTIRFPGHKQVFMFWSPIVYDGRGKSKATQMADVTGFVASIKASHGVDVELVLNETFHACLTDLRAVARKTESAMEPSFMRYLQIEEWLGKFLKSQPEVGCFNGPR